MSSSTKKRITVYLDLEIESDKKVWDYLEGKRKTEIIRNVLSNYVDGVPNVVKKEIAQDSKNANESNITKEELEMINDFVK